jgi:hypothetical protein
MSPGDQVQVEVLCRVHRSMPGEEPYLDAQVTCRNVIYFHSSIVRLTHETRGALRELLVDAARQAIDAELGRLLGDEL